jgi:hypothetical protein
MEHKVCGNCLYYDAQIEPDGQMNGAGWCSCPATKLVSAEIPRAIGHVGCLAITCNQFIPEQATMQDPAHVEALLAPPQMPEGFVLERAIEIQAGRSHRQQDTLSTRSGALPVALGRSHRRLCRVQLVAALANPRFYGRITMVFGGLQRPELLSWGVRVFPRGGEIRT